MGKLNLDARSGMYEETSLHIKYMDSVYSVSMTIKEGLKRKGPSLENKKLDYNIITFPIGYKHYYLMVVDLPLIVGFG